MEIAPDTLRAVYVALRDAHAYIGQPTSIGRTVKRRVATHKLEHHRFAALDATMTAALATLAKMQAEHPG